MRARKPQRRRTARLACAFYACALGFCACNGSARDAKRDAAPACASCHMPEYLAAKKPVHVGVRPTACFVCHTQSAWSPSVFNHPWPLTGAHANARCAACHRGQPPVYAGTSRLCVDCHRADFEGSDFPGHSTFPTTCADCHSTSAWTPAREPPRAGPLAGRGTNEHAPPAQASRPSAGAAGNEARATKRSAKSARTPRGHEAREPSPESTLGGTDTNAEPSSETAPSAANAHAEAETPPETAAAPDVHPENRFPISHGAHAGIRCRTCHDQGGTMGKDNTDCVQCHARAKFDRIHDGVRGYPEGPAPLNFCLRCHGSGRVRGR